MRLLKLLLLPALLLSLNVPAFATTSLRILYTGNLDGELEPCGCTLDTDFGGIQRRASFVDLQRAKHPGLILISTGGLFSAEMGSDQIKHRFILSGLEQLEYDAVGVQWADLTHGEAFLTATRLPFSVVNWASNSLPHHRLINRDGVTLRYLQWLDPHSSPYATMPALSPITPDTSVLRQQLTAAKAAGELTVLATTLDLARAQDQLPLSDVDILLIGSAYEHFGEPQQLPDGPLVLQPGSRGQRIGTLQLTLSDGQIDAWQHQVTELPNTVTSAPRLDAWYQSYNDALREDYVQRVAQRKALDAGGSPYVGAETCKNCHPAQFDVWQQTDHAQAFDSLDRVGKGFDSHCVGCHVVGFNQPGGYLDLTLSDHLAGVQCENCHGGGREHADSAGQKPLPTALDDKAVICAQCHVKEHSPAFNVEAYWPKIAHPRD